MLAASPLISSNGDGREREVPADDFCPDGLSGLPLLDDINFDDLFVGFDDGDILPDLEVDPAEIFAEFSVSGEGDQQSAAETAAAPAEVNYGGGHGEKVVMDGERWEEAAGEAAKEDGTTANGSSSSTSTTSGEVGDAKPRKSSSSAKSSHGKRKVKVDWTPELHRRFVQAVEQLGVDKAVPSRILELMGIDCLTRHNIASHLQKYRSHRKHLLAREAEAATWSQRRQMYAGGGGGGGMKREMSPWIAPTIGFPPATPPIQPFRPLHVWGHPTLDQPLLHAWPRHLVPSPRSAPPPPWPPQPPLHPPPLPDPSAYWHPHYPPRGSKDGWVPNTLTQGTPCYPHPMRYPAPPVPVIVPQPILYRPHSTVPPPKLQPGSQIQLDASPSKESIDAAIGDALSKPWLPLPLGLKPPALDSVLVELQRQGISKVPPTCG